MMKFRVANLNRHSIRVRLTSWYTAALVVLLSLIFVTIYLLAQAQLYTSFDQALQSRLQAVAAVVGRGGGEPSDSGDNGGRGSPNRPNPSLNDIGIEGEYVLLYERGRGLSDWLGQQPTSVEASTWLNLTADGLNHTVQLDDGQQLRVARLTLARSDLIVLVGRSTAAVEGPLHTLLLAFALTLPLAVFLAVVGGLFLSGRLLRPISQISAAAQEIGSHDLSHRLNLGPPRDELTALAATFDQMLDRIAAGMERQRRFTADASHELRTPLQVIAGETELALARPRQAETYRAALTSIQREGIAMQQLVNDLLTLARSDGGQVMVQSGVDLLELADGSVDRLHTRAVAAGVSLRLEAVEDVQTTVCGNEEQLGRVLLNLLDNALKYAASGGQVTVSVVNANHPAAGEILSRELANNGPLAVVTVADSGSGIPAASLPRLFDRFYRADTARTRGEQGGTGLGLAICATIAEQHGGCIGVSSTPQGSHFSLYLPLAQASVH